MAFIQDAVCVSMYCVFALSYLLGDDLLDSNSEASPQKTTTSSSTEMVFCDATKQLLIENVPPVLTLHLKRFLQEGRRLRKNGRHIAFPALLNMAPYCVTDCKVYSYDVV